jgi:hypothetical protein
VQEGVVVSLVATHPEEAASIEGISPQGNRRKRKRHNPHEGHSWGGFNAALGAAMERDPQTLLQAFKLRNRPVAVLVGVYRMPVYVGGRYLKLKRGIPQSPWFEGPKKLRIGESSVQVSQVVYG